MTYEKNRKVYSIFYKLQESQLDRDLTKDLFKNLELENVYEAEHNFESFGRYYLSGYIYIPIIWFHYQTEAVDPADRRDEIRTANSEQP